MDRIQTALHTAFQQLQPLMAESMQRQSITPSQFFVLMYLSKKGSSKVSKLAEHLDVKPSAVTLMMDRLEQHGFVVREHDKKDRRVVNIRLTDEGEEKLRHALQERRDIVRRYLSFLNEEELGALADMSEKIIQAASTTEEQRREQNGYAGEG